MTTTARVLRIFAEEGVAGFFRGVGPRMLKVAPACGLTISSYEAIKTHVIGPALAAREAK